MKRILFLVYHGTSHFNACFGVAKQLSKSHLVTIVGSPYFREHVLRQGLDYYPINTVPFGFGLEAWVNTVEGRRFVSVRAIIDKWRDRLYGDRYASFKKLITLLEPALIFLDAHLSTDAIILKQLTSTKVVLLHTLLPMSIAKDVPALNSGALPGDSSGIIASHERVGRDRRKRNFMQKLKYFGMDDGTIIQRRLKSSGLIDLASKGLSLLPFHPAGFEEFVLAPSSFEFSARPNATYLGSQIDLERKDPMNRAYEKQKEALWRDNSHVDLYCSFGTVPPAQRSLVLEFARKVVEVARTRAYTLVISMKTSDEEKKAFITGGPRIYVFDHVPQLELLSKASVFVTHGGLNSIKEAIHFGVPMLVCPIEYAFDQPGNAARVLYHGLGLRTSLEASPVSELDDKLSRLASDQQFKKSLAAIRTADHANDSERFSDHVLQFLS